MPTINNVYLCGNDLVIGDNTLRGSVDGQCNTAVNKKTTLSEACTLKLVVYQSVPDVLTNKSDHFCSSAS